MVFEQRCGGSEGEQSGYLGKEHHRKEKRFNGLEAEQSMVCLRNGSGWRSKGRARREAQRGEGGPTAGSSRLPEALGSH